MNEIGESVNVHSFFPEQSPLQKIKIGSAATAYACKDGEIILLILNQALLFGNRLPNSLINPNQLRAYGHVVEDTPRQFNPESTHSISILGEGGFVIPLELKGVISCFTSHKPTDRRIAGASSLRLINHGTQMICPSLNSRKQLLHMYLQFIRTGTVG